MILNDNNTITTLTWFDNVPTVWKMTFYQHATDFDLQTKQNAIQKFSL